MNSFHHIALALNPLTLPELRMLVGRYLATRDILTCVLVCRDWYRDYKPLLYRSIRLDEATLRLLPKEQLRQNAHLFRHLVMMEPMRLTMASIGPLSHPPTLDPIAFPASKSELAAPATASSPPPSSPSCSLASPPSTTSSKSHCQTPAAHCHNLRTLDIHPTIMFRKRVHEQVPKHKVLTVGTDRYDILKDDFWCLQSTDACIRLIQLNPNLHSLTESWDDMSSFHRIRFADQLCRLPNRLVRLHLSKWEVTPETLNGLIENSPLLEILRFSKLTIKNSTGLAVGLRTEQPLQQQQPLQLQRQQQQGGGSTTSAVTAAGVGAKAGSIQDPLERTALSATLNFRQLKIFAVTHASFQLGELHINAPELDALSISFSQVNFTQPIDVSSPAPGYSPHQQHPRSPYSRPAPPQVLWTTPRLEKLICNRTESNVATSTLLEIPQTLKSVSFANYELESRMITQVVAAQSIHLESIRLACFSGITARDVRLILTKCPNLVNFFAPEIMMWAGDLVHIFEGGDSTVVTTSSTTADTATMGIGKGTGTGTGAPAAGHAKTSVEGWACHRLERLSVYVCLEASAVDDGGYENPYQIHHQYHQPPVARAASSLFGSSGGEATANAMEIKKTAQQQRLYPQLYAHQPYQQCWQQQQPQPPYHLQQQQQQQQHQQHQPQQCQDPSQQHSMHEQHPYDANAHIRNAFLNQLAQLPRLRHLDLSGEHVEKVDDVQIGLPWTVDHGLSKLESLKELEHVAVTGWIDEMKSQDIEWMKRSWPRLSRISLLKTGTESMSRFRRLVGKTWPELTVQDKDRNNGYCPPMYVY